MPLAVFQTTSPSDFWNKLRRGFTCFYGFDTQCGDVPSKAVIYILSYCLGNMFNLLLIKYTDGAVYSVIVQALVTPLATIFWTLFKAEPTFMWFPVFNQSTIYVLGGLVIMMPSVIMYTIFSGEADAGELQETDVYSEIGDRSLRKVNSEPSLHAIY